MYISQIRMKDTRDPSGQNAPWISGSRFESESQAESFAAWTAKQWYGAAESRSIEVESSESPSFKQCGESPEIEAPAKPKRKRVAKKARPEIKAKVESSTEPWLLLPGRLALISALNQRADDLIDQAEMDREYRENMWRNHDCDPEESPGLCSMTFEEVMQARYEREMEESL